MKILKVFAVALIGIAGLDLLTGNSSKPVLPSFLGNMLSQNIDVVLIGIGVLVLIFG